jgi:hypothetical protein
MSSPTPPPPPPGCPAHTHHAHACTAPPPQRQVVQLSSSVNDVTGTFRVGFQGELTDYLAHDVTASEMKRAVDGIMNTRNTRVLRSATPTGFGYRWTIIFSGLAGSGNANALTFDDTTLRGTGTPALSVETDLTTAVGCGTCATVTQFSDEVATSASLTTSVRVNDLIAVGPTPEYFVVVSITASTIKLSSPYQGTSSASASIVTGSAVPGELLDGYHAQELTVEELLVDRLPGETEPYR